MAVLLGETSVPPACSTRRDSGDVGGVERSGEGSPGDRGVVGTATDRTAWTHDDGAKLATGRD